MLSILVWLLNLLAFDLDSIYSYTLTLKFKSVIHITKNKNKNYRWNKSIENTQNLSVNWLYINLSTDLE